MDSVKRILIIVCFSFIIGFIFNQFSPLGIKWPLLLPSFLVDSQLDPGNVQIISPDSAYVIWQSGEAQFLDCRSEEDYKIDHIQNAINVPFDEIIAGKKIKIEEKKYLVVYDEDGNLENLKVVAFKLLESKKIPIFLIYGGYVSWLEGAYPTEMGEKF